MILGWLGNLVIVCIVGSIIVLIFLIYVFIVLGELYFKCIVMNLKDCLVIVLVFIIIFLGKIVSFFVWLFLVLINLLSRIILMIFDDVDEKMICDEIEYMLMNSEEILDVEEIEML